MRVDAYRASERRNALGKFGKALNKEQCETSGEQSLRGPQDQPARVHRQFIRLERIEEERPSQIGEVGHHREQKDREAEDVDPQPRPVRDPRIQQINADVLVKPQRLRCPEKHDAAEHVPLDLQQSVRTEADQITDDRVACTHEAGEKHKPFRYVTGDIADAVDNEREFYDVQRIPPDQPACICFFLPRMREARLYSAEAI